MAQKIGALTLACRLICSALIGFTIFDYTIIVLSDGNGNAYVLFILLVLAFFAGIILIINSLYCLYSYRNIESYWISIVFMLVGGVGIFLAWHFLPQFRM